MIKKSLTAFCLFLLIALFMSPAFVYSQKIEFVEEEVEEEIEEGYDFASMTTYELFWPVTAGKVPGDKFYNIKRWRDNFLANLFFSKSKKAEYFKQLANKRLVEADKLVELRRYSFLSQTLAESRGNLEKGLELLLLVEEGWPSIWLRSEYKKDLEKHQVILERMKEKVEGESGAAIEKALKEIQDLGEKHELKITP